MVLGSASELFENLDTMVTLLGNQDQGQLDWSWEKDQVQVQLPSKAEVASENAWVLKIVADK